MASGSENFVNPLLDEDIWKNNQSLGKNIGETSANHHDSLTKTHFIGNEPPANAARRVKASFIGGAPNNSIELMLLEVDFTRGN